MREQEPSSHPTPGPWEVGDTSVPTAIFVYDAVGRQIGLISDSGQEIPPSETVANARLIAQAWAIPQLMDALKASKEALDLVMETMPPQIPDDGQLIRAAYDQVREALALLEPQWKPPSYIPRWTSWPEPGKGPGS